MHQVTEKNWREVCALPKAVVEFSAPWCGPCKVQKQIMHDLEPDVGEVFEVNIDEDFKLADEMSVKSVPTIVVLANGREKRRLTGLQQKEAVRRVLKED